MAETDQNTTEIEINLIITIFIDSFDIKPFTRSSENKPSSTKPKYL